MVHVSSATDTKRASSDQSELRASSDVWNGRLDVIRDSDTGNCLDCVDDGISETMDKYAVSRLSGFEGGVKMSA